MPGTPEPTDKGSPEGSPPAPAILPPALAIARAEHDRARRVSMELRKTFEVLSREVEPEVEPDMERPEPDLKKSLELASLGVELAHKEKEAIQLERDVVAKERDAGILSPNAAGKRFRNLSQRYLSAGDDLWRHQKKKIRFDDPGTIRLLEPRSNAVSECLLVLYKKSDGLEKRAKRPKDFRDNALDYYKASGQYHEGRSKEHTWCHVSGSWHPAANVKAAHIVPFFMDYESIGEILFGDRAQSLRRPGNALLLLDRIKGWFDSYHIVIVPVDAKETPITRWKTELISPHIRKAPFSGLRDGNELDGKELKFHDEKRPVSRFLYFHFIMALVRIKDIKREGWQDVWARYYTQRPFPTPGNYIRRSMLLAIATHFETADMQVIESWIADHGFDSSLTLAADETMEAARRVHLAVEAATSRAEEQENLEEDSSMQEN